MNILAKPQPAISHKDYILMRNRVAARFKGIKIYRPFKQQIELHESSSRVLVFSAAARVGKSFWAAMHMMPYLYTPGSIIYILAPIYSIGRREFTYMRYDHEMLRKAGMLPKNIVSERVSDVPGKGDHAIRIKWKGGEESSVVIKTEKSLANLLGEEVTLACLSEAPQLKHGYDAWDNYLEPRTAILLCPYTPNGYGCFPMKLFHKGLKDHPDYDKTGEFHSVVATVLDAPHYMNDPKSRGKYERALAIMGMEHPLFRQNYLGEYVERAGLIYPQFSEVKHVRPVNTDGWTTYLAIDFGSVDPFVCLWVAFKDDLEDPGISVDPSCTNTITEFKTWKHKTVYSEEVGILEKPDQAGNHAMDALRYVITSMRRLGKWHIYHEMYVNRPSEKGLSSADHARNILSWNATHNVQYRTAYCDRRGHDQRLTMYKNGIDNIAPANGADKVEDGISTIAALLGGWATRKNAVEREEVADLTIKLTERIGMRRVDGKFRIVDAPQPTAERFGESFIDTDGNILEEMGDDFSPFVVDRL